MEQDEFDTLISTKIAQIIKAAEDMHNNYAKAAGYIDRTIWNIVEASIEQGKACLVNELFCGE